MAKQQVTWQITPETVEKVKSLAKKRKVAIQLIAEELILKGLDK